MSILAVLEQQHGEIRTCALEVASRARQIAERAGLPLFAICLGAPPADQLRHLAGFNIRELTVFESDDVAMQLQDVCLPAIHELALAQGAQVLIGSATLTGKELFASLAARLGAELLQDCIGTEWDHGLKARKAIYAGKIVSELRFLNGPALLTLRPNLFAVERSGADLPRVVMAKRSPAPHLALVKDVVRSIGGGVNLTEAKVVVAGGRGLGGPQNWPLLQELCEVTGGVLGASRAAVDAGWIEHARQIGQTGKVVSPDLYIACGISGAIQHQAGMRGAKVVVAVNKDPEAEIFKFCDYGIVGDLLQVVPALTREARKAWA